MAESKFENAKKDLKKSIETDRITEDAIIYNYLGLQRLGETQDKRRDTYQALDKITLQDIANFQKNYIAHKPNTYCIVASDKKVSPEQLQKLGNLKKLSLEELFGY